MTRSWLCSFTYSESNGSVGTGTRKPEVKPAPVPGMPTDCEAVSRASTCTWLLCSELRSVTSSPKRCETSAENVATSWLVRSSV